jgi:hypothetical protein
MAFGRSQLDEVSSCRGIKGSLSAASPQRVRIADGKSSIARAELPAQVYSLKATCRASIACPASLLA